MIILHKSTNLLIVTDSIKIVGTSLKKVKQDFMLNLPFRVRMHVS